MIMQIEELKQIEFNKRELELEHAKKQELVHSSNKKETLHITYVMTWTGICGGTKIILEHANRLTNSGHKITLISHDKKPTWFYMDKRVEFIQVPWGEILCSKIPKCDLIITTYWREIYEAVQQKIAPVIYFEQGDYHLFELEKLDNRTYEYIQKQLKTVNFIYTVSSFAKKKLKEIYNVEADVIPNAVDDKIFYYKKHKQNLKTNITIIGSQEAKFKRIEDILKAIDIIKQKGYKIELNWITPTEPSKQYKANIKINPEQIIIGNTLRNTDIYICASVYESFCLPVLEAMTCGAAVITTNNGGNMDFVEDGKNALIIKKEDTNDIVEKIELLLNNSTLREEIAENAIKTSQKFSWNITIDSLIKYYKEIAKYSAK